MVAVGLLGCNGSATSLAQKTLYLLVLALLPVLTEHSSLSTIFTYLHIHVHAFNQKEVLLIYAMWVCRQLAAGGAKDLAQPEAHRGRHYRRSVQQCVHPL